MSDSRIHVKRKDLKAFDSDSYVEVEKLKPEICCWRWAMMKGHGFVYVLVADSRSTYAALKVVVSVV